MSMTGSSEQSIESDHKDVHQTDGGEGLRKALSWIIVVSVPAFGWVV